ncbi:hypothetical protein [uncultured Oscillibacter sp.]|uniref:hypothetical protein n=1 Tax=uncultured Oscillibacter sp. TaxID=876091 RepID=UPI0025F86B5D|nr:hypothetical protein [uncultured Oscillibacter sp.]
MSKLYDELCNKKEAGEELNFNKLTRDKLYELWYVECIPDSAIAELYGVLQKEVKKKRFEFGIKQTECATDNILKHLFKRNP